jgi:hypothetical protein
LSEFALAERGFETGLAPELLEEGDCLRLADRDFLERFRGLKSARKNPKIRSANDSSFGTEEYLFGGELERFLRREAEVFLRTLLSPVRSWLGR